MGLLAFDSHLNSLQSSLALFWHFSRIVSIFSKFWGSPNDRKINYLLLYAFTLSTKSETLPRRVLVATNLLGAFEIVYIVEIGVKFFVF